MDKKKITARWSIIALIIFVVTLFRFIPYLSESFATFNFSPIAAIALFGGAYFSRKYMAFALPFLALWLSNLLLDNIFLAEYYEGFAFFANWEVYLSFLLVVGLGILLLKKVTVLRVIAASLSASVLFFVVSNFFVWASGTLYPMSVAGLIECFIAAVPFFWNTLGGDLFFVTLMFGSFEILKSWNPKMALQKA